MNHISLLYFSQNSSEMVLLSEQDIFQFRTSGAGAGGVNCRLVQLVEKSAADVSCRLVQQLEKSAAGVSCRLVQLVEKSAADVSCRQVQQLEKSAAGSAGGKECCWCEL